MSRQGKRGEHTSPPSFMLSEYCRNQRATPGKTKTPPPCGTGGKGSSIGRKTIEVSSTMRNVTHGAMGNAYHLPQTHMVMVSTRRRWTVLPFNMQALTL